MSDILSVPKIDLLFICDITGSMGGLIADAQKRMKDILSKLSEEFQVHTKVGLSLYRDHANTGDSDFVTITFDLMEIKDIQAKIDGITVNGGGGNGGEAVLDGIVEGIQSMSWRDGSRRIAFLIGDEPPHGMNGLDTCFCGLTWGKAVSVAEEHNVPIYAIPLDQNFGYKIPDNGLIGPFKTLSTFSGGVLLLGDNALDVVLSTLREQFSDISLGARVLEMFSKDNSPEEICKMLNIDREKLSELEAKSLSLK